MTKEVLRRPFIKNVVILVLTSALIGSILGSLLTIALIFSPNDFLGTANIRAQNDSTPAPAVFSEEQQIVQVVERTTAAVVSIIITKDLPVFERFFFDPFGGISPFQFQIPQFRQRGTQEQRIGGGSGFIISSDGLIVTNKHVVNEQDADYTVLTSEGKKFPAKVLARDPVQDLAILKIEAKNLPTVRLGDSDNIKTGQKAIAIGYALGEFQNTVSVGVISGLLRSVTAGGGGFSEVLEGVIQTDAAINPGNSGGPLLNLKGEVIGVNTAMAQGAENIGFAIPVNNVKKDIEEVKTRGKITYPFLGVRYVLITPEIKEERKLSVDDGALVLSGENEPAIVPGSPAERAGIKEGDIILEINGKKIDLDHSLARLLGNHRAGEKVTLRVLRGGKRISITVALGERPA